jgi:hypothetical protein
MTLGTGTVKEPTFLGSVIQDPTTSVNIMIASALSSAQDSWMYSSFDFI